MEGEGDQQMIIQPVHKVATLSKEEFMRVIDNTIVLTGLRRTHNSSVQPFTSSTLYGSARIGKKFNALSFAWGLAGGKMVITEEILVHNKYLLILCPACELRGLPHISLQPTHRTSVGFMNEYAILLIATTLPQNSADDWIQIREAIIKENETKTLLCDQEHSDPRCEKDYYTVVANGGLNRSCNKTISLKVPVKKTKEQEGNRNSTAATETCFDRISKVMKNFNLRISGFEKSIVPVLRRLLMDQSAVDGCLTVGENSTEVAVEVRDQPFHTDKDVSYTIVDVPVTLEPNDCRLEFCLCSGNILQICLRAGVNVCYTPYLLTHR